jgi:ring-1,2-phenylacetyl-CoA epoxidase subunit PaaD
MVSAWETARSVPDPELPYLTVADLGILRDVREDGDAVTVTITPTYSGCPAMHQIAADLVHHLKRAGYRHVDIKTALSPAWTSDWITAEGRRKLSAAGIAPPRSAAPAARGPVPVTLTRAPVRCPRCGSADTRQTARFSATACKALYLCRECLEPFEYVKEF